MYESCSELLKQITLGEDSVLELKAVEFNGNKIVGPHKNGMADELAAMANTASGIIILGVDDKSRERKGIPLEKLDIVEGWIRSICNDSIEPPLDCVIRKLIVLDHQGDEKIILRIDVLRSLFVHKSPNGYFRRLGSSRREMKPDVLARLFQQRSQTRLIRFDEQTVPGTSPNDLNPKLWNRFRTVISSKDDQKFLEKMNLIAIDRDGVARATVSGILMASDAPESFMSSAFIQAVCYRGIERNSAYQLDAKDITGPLDVQIRDACKFVERNMRVFAIKAPNRIETPQFSMNAVFEAVVNAVAHRDYAIYGAKIRLHLFSDRLEIFSPGTIPNTMTLESISERQSARNELITSLLARCSMNVVVSGSSRNFIMDKRGEGVPIIITESMELSEKKPEYRLLDDSELMLTIFAYEAQVGNQEAQVGNQEAQVGNQEAQVEDQEAQVRDQEAQVDLTTTEKEILSALNEGERSGKELVEAAGYKSRTGNFKRSLEKLLTTDLIRMTNPDNPQASNQKYIISEDGLRLLNT